MELKARLDLRRHSRRDTPLEVLLRPRSGVKRLGRHTFAVDFSQTPHLRDPYTAVMCISVLTSDGRVGTLSHLPPEANIAEAVERVLRFHNGIAPVCLSGGWRLDDSLLGQIEQSFGFVGFNISLKPENADLGLADLQITYRRACLYSDRVRVQKTTGTKDLPSVDLVFPEF